MHIVNRRDRVLISCTENELWNMFVAIAEFAYEQAVPMLGRTDRVEDNDTVLRQVAAIVQARSLCDDLTDIEHKIDLDAVHWNCARLHPSDCAGSSECEELDDPFEG